MDNIGDKNLAGIKENETAVIKELCCKNTAKRRFLDLGIVDGTSVTKLFKSPYGDPIAFFIRGAVIALRKEDCEQILIY